MLSAETIPPVESDSDAPESQTSVAPETEPADDSDSEDLARALITPTGIVAPIVVDLGDSYVVTTPCGNKSEVVWGITLSTVDVVLDPGHGGDVETGAVGPNGLAEKDLNLDVARRTARELEQRGISVVLTRTADYRMPLSVRAEIANRLRARALVSIHHNAPNANPSDIPGTEVFVQQDSDESRRLGGILWEEIVDALGQFDVAWTTATDAGAVLVLNDDGNESYGMIRRPEVPAVLAELGYLSNPPEAELFETLEYRQVAAVALADSIERFLSTEDAGSGFVADPRTFNPSGLTGGSNGCEDPPLE